MMIRYDAAQGRPNRPGGSLRQRPIENNPNGAAQGKPNRPPSKPPSNRPESEFNQKVQIGKPNRPTSKPPSNRPESEFNQKVQIGKPSKPKGGGQPAGKPKVPVDQFQDRVARARVKQGLEPQKLSEYPHSNVMALHSHLENHPGANPSHASHQEWKSNMGLVKAELKKRG